MKSTDKTVSLTLLGDVNEVGGNKVLLEDFTYDVKLFLDFGIKIGKFYDCYESGEHPSCIEQLIESNLIPNEDSIPINNLYTREFENAKVKVIKNINFYVKLEIFFKMFIY